MNIDSARWHPERKVIGAAAAVLVIFALQVAADIAGITIDVPPGVEGAIAVVVAYWVRNPRVNEAARRNLAEQVPDNSSDR